MLAPTLTRLNTNVRHFLITTSLVGLTVDGGIFSVLFNLYLTRLGYSPAFIGSVNAAGQIIFTVGCLPAGLLGGRWGTRRTMVLGLSIMTLGCGLIPLAELAPLDWRNQWLMTSYVILYGGMALHFVNGPPFLMSSVGADMRSTGFSLQIATWSISAFAGALVGGLLPGALAAAFGLSTATPAPYRVPLMLAALLLVPALVSMATARDVVRDTVTEPQDGDKPFPWLLVAGLAVVRLLQVGAVATTVPFFNVYMDSGLGVPTAQIGLIASAGRLLAAPVALLAPRVIARWGTYWVVAVGSLVVALCTLPMALVPHWTAAGVSFIGVVSLSSFRFSAFLIYSLEAVGRRWQSTQNGVSEMASGVTFAGLTFLGGFWITDYGYAPLFMSGGILSALGALLFWAAFRPMGKRV